MTPPEVSNTNTLSSLQPSDASVSTCCDNQIRHPSRPSRRSAGLASSSVVHPPEIPHRDAMSVSAGISCDGGTVLLVDDDKHSLTVNVCSAGRGTPPPMQRLQPTTSTAPPPRFRNGAPENALPGAFRVTGLLTGSLDTIQSGRIPQESTSRMGRDVSHSLRRTAFRPLVNAFLVEDQPMAVVSSGTVSFEESSYQMDFSGTTDRVDWSTSLKQEENKEEHPAVNAVPVVVPRRDRRDRSFCDLLKDWRVLVLIFFFIMIIVGMAIGPGIHGSLNSSKKSLEATQSTLEPIVTQSPSNSVLPVATLVPVNNPANGSITSFPNSRAPHSLAPSMNAGGAMTSAPTFTLSRSPTRRPTSSMSEQQLPTEAPTKAPTHAPTTQPVVSPTRGPTSTVTGAPTFRPTKAPTREEQSHAPYYPPTRTPAQKPNANHGDDSEEHDDD